MTNIVLIGMPGCGKTTLGKMLSEELGMNLVDFDDDIIEGTMNQTVGEVLDELGEEKFLELEEKLVHGLQLENTILSSSGSVPLRPQSIAYLKKQAILIYINVPVSTIKTRLAKMKVDRIVGMKDMTMDEILEYRQDYYNNSFDYKFDTEGLGDKSKTYSSFILWFKAQGIV